MTDKQRQETYAQMLVRLSRSNFRSRFHLKAQDKQYIRDKGWNTIADHAADFVSKRLAPAVPKNDGKQTPMRGHPVFIAQHATACCCRGCLEKWHGIPQAAFGGAAGLYRWNADELDEERNGKLRIRVRVKRDLRFTALHRIKKRRSCVSSAILAYSCG